MVNQCHLAHECALTLKYFNNAVLFKQLHRLAYGDETYAEPLRKMVMSTYAAMLPVFAGQYLLAQLIGDLNIKRSDHIIVYHVFISLAYGTALFD